MQGDDNSMEQKIDKEVFDKFLRRVTARLTIQR